MKLSSITKSQEQSNTPNIFIFAKAILFYLFRSVSRFSFSRSVAYFPHMKNQTDPTAKFLHIPASASVLRKLLAVTSNSSVNLIHKKITNTLKFKKFKPKNQNQVILKLLEESIGGTELQNIVLIMKI